MYCSGNNTLLKITLDILTLLRTIFRGSTALRCTSSVKRLCFYMCVNASVFSSYHGNSGWGEKVVECVWVIEEMTDSSVIYARVIFKGIKVKFSLFPSTSLSHVRWQQAPLSFSLSLAPPILPLFMLTLRVVDIVQIFLRTHFRCNPAQIKYSNWVAFFV